MQGCAFRGHDESVNSTNRGNFIEMIKLQAKVNQEIAGIVLGNSPQNAKYTSPRIQKELLNILANKVRAKIREEIRDAKFCILVDETVDESNKEQMAIILSASSKRHSELKSIREDEIQELTALGELETGTGANQIRTLQRPGATRWSSHFTSIDRLIIMFGSTSTLLENVIDKGLNSNIRGEAKSAYKDLRSFEFVFILFLLHKVLVISNMLCQALQLKSQDILNAMNLVSTTKMLLQKLRESEWDTFLESIVSFCERYEIDIPNMNARHT
ncbi:hypothetical protein LWI28_003097 [Acer negundo]|uniref:DUF4371 domain-containing protein n=1 Tax=Acer negundo TaxID=4023 RepID=A0AAD5NUN7_ACENE|nr:hypothetical protein LWI28_003097 [Acer negundo]